MRRPVPLYSLLLLAVGLLHAQIAQQPTESEHRRGPRGMEGWTLSYPLPDRPNEAYPATLILARNGHVVRRIHGDAFIWKWMFRADGRRVAYESGPLHFGLQCVLKDVATGRTLGSVDCFHELGPGAPDWAKTLESSK